MNPVENPAEQVYDEVKLKKAKLTIGGELVYEENEPILAVPSARFNSGHFAHNNQITINLECIFAVRQGTIWTELSPLTATIKPKPYNQLATWKAKTDAAGYDWSNDNLNIVNLVYSKGRDIFAACGYNVLSEDSIASKPEILARIDVATGTYAIAHGAETGLYDSYMTLLMSWNDIEAKTASPVHQLAIFYACDALKDPVKPRDAFRAASAAKGVAGFQEPVKLSSTDSGTGEVTSLSAHANRLFDYLSAGYRLGTAVTKANDEIFVESLITGNRQNMVVVGDEYATLKSVYLTPSERQAMNVANTTFTDWKLVIR